MSNAAKQPNTQAASATTLPLLLEIGCEEIPARFLGSGQKNLGEALEIGLGELGLLEPNYPAPKTYSTPRRLVVSVPAILNRQPDIVKEIVGPPVKTAFDAEGKPTKSSEGFARKYALAVADLIKVSTERGEYLAARITLSGKTAVQLLPDLLRGVIENTADNFPKSMYWTGKSGPRFIRPIRWILALLGEGKNADVIPFEIAGVKAGDFTFGHRAIGQNPIRVSSFKEYVQKLNQSQVEIEPEKRRDRVRQECKVLLEGSELSVVEDKALEDWIVNSTEWPRGLLGNFEERFLKLPREILVTVMRDHQKYFAVEDENGSLRPSFVTLLNVAGDPKGLICRGHERVLTARFSDAEFFWKADQKVTLEQRRGMLEKVTYQAKLGSYADKVRRMELIAKQVCATLFDQGKMKAEDTTHTLRAVQLCKCDLTTQMVQELTELQGIVGGLYAKAQGEPQPVSDAIYDHYLPQGADDKCPRSLVGAVVSLADKIDSVAAGFAAGLEPTGSSDPFGLRRAGNGAVKLLVEFGIPVSIEMRPESQLGKVADDVRTRLRQFVQERIQHYLEAGRGFRYDTVRAVLGRRSELADQSPLTSLKIAKALEEIRGTENFLALTSSAKRIRNILKKSATELDWLPGVISENLLIEEEEKALYKSCWAAVNQTTELEINGQYKDALGIIAALRPVVDHFFDKVLVMAEDRNLRQNRLRLLNSLDKTFSSIADLSQIESSTSTSVDASTVGMTGAAGE